MSTKDTGHDYRLYVYAVQEELTEHQEILAELEQKLSREKLNRIDRAAAERCIQVLVEIAIGCSKHVLKKNALSAPSEAGVAVRKAYELLKLEQPAQDVLKGAVGMRNAIVHDYLDLDWSKIEAVIKHGQYRQVSIYVHHLCQNLLETGER